MQKTVFINVQGHNVQAAITGMIEQMDKMSADPKFKDFEFHSSNITVTFEAPPKKSNLVPMNGGMVQPVMIINHTVTLVEKINTLPGQQEIADLKKAFQMKCVHQNFTGVFYSRTENGGQVNCTRCADCGAEVSGSLVDQMLEHQENQKQINKIRDTLQIPIDPIGDQLDEKENRYGDLSIPEYPVKSDDPVERT